MPFPSRPSARFGRPLPFAACALASGASLAAEPADWHVVGSPQSSEACGFVLRKGDSPFKAFVDGVLVRLMRRGEIDALYDRGFRKPAPRRRCRLTSRSAT